MLASDLIEVLCAAHLTYFVKSPFESRGGIILTGAPGVLKSTFLDVLDRQYHDAVVMSDVNARSLSDLRDQISTGAIRTLVLPELAKLYERAEATAQNVEGTLRAIADEGFQAASFEDQRINRIKARALVMGALTPKTRENHFTAWEESGFNRRFLWPLIRLHDPNLLERAVVEWRMLDFQVGHIPRPPLSSESITNRTTAAERQILQGWVKYQPGGSHALHLQLLTKILCVLRWWYDVSGKPGDPMAVLSRFAESLGRTGATVEIQERPISPQRRAAEVRKLEQEQVKAAARKLAARSRSKRQKKGRRS